MLLGLALVLAIVVKAFFVQAFFVPSVSMEPTFLKQDRILVEKWSYWSGDVQRGDIVVFDDPGGWLGPAESQQPSNVVQKGAGGVRPVPDRRPPGEAGDRGRRRRGQRAATPRAGSRSTACALDETDYLMDGVRPSMQTFDVKVPDGSLWVMGDNRPQSGDSRLHMGSAGRRFRARRRRRGQGLGDRLAARPHRDPRPAGDLRRTRPSTRRRLALDERAAEGCDRPPRRGVVRLRAGAAPCRARPGRRRRRGRARRVRRVRWWPPRSVLPEGGAGSSPGWPTPSCSPRHAREACYEQVRRPGAGLVGGGAAGRPPATSWACTSPTSRRCGGRWPGCRCARAYVLTDGFGVDGLEVPGLAVWKGDRVAACIAAASVIAKVTRDRIMCGLHARLPAVRLRRAQGLLHPRARRRPGRARAVPRAPPPVRQRPLGRRGYTATTPTLRTTSAELSTSVPTRKPTERCRRCR